MISNLSNVLGEPDPYDFNLPLPKPLDPQSIPKSLPMIISNPVKDPFALEEYDPNAKKLQKKIERKIEKLDEKFTDAELKEIR